MITPDNRDLSNHPVNVIRADIGQPPIDSVDLAASLASDAVRKEYLLAPDPLSQSRPDTRSGEANTHSGLTYDAAAGLGGIAADPTIRYTRSGAPADKRSGEIDSLPLAPRMGMSLDGGKTHVALFKNAGTPNQQRVSEWHSR